MKTTSTPLSVGALLCAAALAACGSSDDAVNARAKPEAPGPAPGVDAGAAAPLAVCPEGEPFRLVTNKIVVDVSIDGGPKQKWFLDTGAPETVADRTIESQVLRKTVKLTAGGLTKELAPSIMDVRSAARSGRGSGARRRSARGSPRTRGDRNGSCR